MILHMGQIDIHINVHNDINLLMIQMGLNAD